MAAKEETPRINIYIFIILLVLVAGLLYWIFFLKPAQARLGELREANAAQEQEIAALEVRVAQKSATEQRWNALREKESFLREKVPEASALPEVLGALEETIFAASLEVGQINAYEFRDSEGYRYIPVSVMARGSQEELLTLLEKIEQFAHHALVGDVRLEEVEKGHRLDLDFDLIFYLEGQDKAMGTEVEG